MAETDARKLALFRLNHAKDIAERMLNSAKTEEDKKKYQDVIDKIEKDIEKL